MWHTGCLHGLPGEGRFSAEFWMPFDWGECWGLMGLMGGDWCRGLRGRVGLLLAPRPENDWPEDVRELKVLGNEYGEEVNTLQERGMVWNILIWWKLWFIPPYELNTEEKKNHTSMQILNRIYGSTFVHGNMGQLCYLYGCLCIRLTVQKACNS